MSKGIIYVLSNPAMPDIVKIGKTNNINQRLSSLYSTGVPLPFKCVYAKEVDDMNFAEVKLHAGLSSTRINEKREFFKISEDELIHLFDLIAGNDVTPDKEIFETKEDKVAFEKASRLGERFNFGLVDIDIGSTLTFLKDEDITCEVISNKEVRFDGKNHSLSSAGVIAIQMCGYKWEKIAGPKFWKYEGETVYEIRERLENNE
jgi:hypothetical protein